MAKKGGMRPGAGRPKGATNKRTRALRARVLADEALTVESTVEAIRRGLAFDARALYDADGDLRPITELSEAEAWAIAGFEVVLKNAAAGDGHTDRVLRIRLIDRAKYVELAARYLGMLTDRMQVKGTLRIISET